MEMKMKLTFLTKLTAGGLVALAIALWIQWLSGDPAYTKFPPGPVLFIGVAAICYLRGALVVDAHDGRPHLTARHIRMVCPATSGDTAPEPSQ